MDILKKVIPRDTEMGKLILEKDWGNTGVGPVENWPFTLRSLLGIMLNNKFPMFLFWGEKHTCFYNDAYRPSLGKDGKHPDILGMDGEHAWPEIWDIIRPWIDKAMAGDGATYFEDNLVPIYRNGKMEEVYWTFSYSPAFNDQGDVSGVIVTCSETTQAVLARQDKEVLTSRLDKILRHAPVSIMLYKCPEYIIEISNDMASELAGRSHDELVGKPLFEAFPEIEAQGFRQLLDSVLESKKRFSADEIPVELMKDGELVKLTISLIYEPLLDEHGEVEYIMAVGTDISVAVEAKHELQLALQQVGESEEQFRLLADSMPQFVWAGDANGDLNYFNQAVFEYSGLSYEDVVKNGWIQIVHPDDREDNISRWKHSVRTGEEFHCEHRFKRDDGVYRWQLSRAVPVRGESGKIRKWVGTSTDIQQIKEQEIEKDIFLGMASHELKTPVTSIKGYVDILRSMFDESNDEFLKNSLEIINKQLNTLVALIKDMLDLSKMKSGNLMLCKERFSLTNMIGEVVNDMQFSNPDIEIVYTSEDEVEVWGDANRLGQVLVNFLTNAIKYSPEKGTIKVSCEKSDNQVKVSVQDQGIGIKKSDQEHIFKRFYRVEGKNEVTYPGFGIGLFIAADIIQRHHGEIGVNSEIGKGSEFYFDIPLVAVL